MEAIKIIQNIDYKLEIFQDDCYESPREWDNMGTMICFHSRYNLGDKHDYSREEAEELSKGKNIISLPLYLYDHSGITMSTSDFGCRFDSGCYGFIYVTKENVRKEYNVKRITKKIIEKVINVLKGEVETYDQYLTGDVYGYRVSKIEVCDKGHKHDEELHSCWGYYGMESVEEEGRSMLEYYIEKEEEKSVSS